MKIFSVLIVFIVLIGLGTNAFATDSEPSTAQADKSAYTLFHPTPVDLMRDMQTDRPNRTNTPDTVDAGHVQLESGVLDASLFRSRSSRRDTFLFGEENLRVGVLDSLEFNVAVSLYNQQAAQFEFGPVAGKRPSGVGDLYLGGTLNLFGNDAGDKVWAISLAFSPQLKFPTASSSVGNGRFEAYFGVPMLINLPAGFHLSAETIGSLERNSNSDGYTTGWQNMICVDHVIFSKVDVYLEYWSHSSFESHEMSQQTIDIGATYALNDSVVLDTGFNFGLNHASVDFEWVAGFSVRF